MNDTPSLTLPIAALADCTACRATPHVNYHRAADRWTIACGSCERGVAGGSFDRAAARWRTRHHRPSLSRRLATGVALIAAIGAAAQLLG